MDTTVPTAVIETRAGVEAVRDCLIENDPTGFQVAPYHGGYIVTLMTRGNLGPQYPIVWTARISPTENQGARLEAYKNYAGQFYDRDVIPCLARFSQR